MANYQKLIAFHSYYTRYHGYIALVVCLFGIISNLLNITVLSRKELRTATNLFLLAIAYCHFVLNIIYSLYVLHDFLVYPNLCDPNRVTFEWISYTMLFAQLSVTIYGYSTWLSVCLALIRCLQIRTNNQHYSSISLTAKIMAFCFVATVCLCVPNYISFSVRENVISIDDGCLSWYPNFTRFQPIIVWNIGASNFSERYDDIPLRLTYWIIGFIFFIIPSLMLTVLICYLVWTLKDFEKRRKKLALKRNRRNRYPAHQHTLLLLLVLAILLITQIPQGFLNLLCSFLSEEYRLDVYQNLGEVMDLLSLINASISFVVYCSMSSQFRQTFLRLFRPKCCQVRVDSTLISKTT